VLAGARRDNRGVLVVTNLQAVRWPSTIHPGTASSGLIAIIQLDE
jgi:hypothetical protein